MKKLFTVELHADRWCVVCDNKVIVVDFENKEKADHLAGKLNDIVDDLNK